MDDVSQARKRNPTESDLVAPAQEANGAPHDRGHVNADGEYRDAVDEMYERVKDDLKAWREGLTQHFPVK
jgi:hypothetical protein